jgi:hypothetical protein
MVNRFYFLRLQEFIMCNLMILAAASAGAQAYGAYAGAKAEKEAGSFNAQMLARNAELDQQRARDALIRGEQDIFKRQLETSQTEGSQRAILAARGLSLESGSALNILSDTGYIGRLDVSTLRSNAEREARGLSERAGASYREAEFLQRRARRIDPLRQAGLSLLGSAGTVAASNYRNRSTQSNVAVS